MTNLLNPLRFDGYHWWTFGCGKIADAEHYETWWVKCGPVSIGRTREYGVEVFALGDFCVYSVVHGGFALSRV